MPIPRTTLHFRMFALPKRGNSVEEYEDAWAADPQRGRFAIADGASESSFASVWARLLVEGFVQTPVKQPGKWEDWIPELQRRWAEEIGDRATSSWYAEEKFEQGAFAAFLGLVLSHRVSKSGIHRTKWWKAIAIGDSCLFQVREDHLLKAFPVKHSKEFSNNPRLVGSRNDPHTVLPQKEVREQGDWAPEDRFWLMTDALAQWFLEEHEAGEKPWQPLQTLLEASNRDQAFASWVNQLRDQGKLRNDDVSLVAVSL